MRRFIYAVIFLSFVSSLARAAELTLFDLPLRTASREELRAAIKAAGGTLKSTARDTDIYNASKIGVPGAEEIEVVYLGEKLVLAQYRLSYEGKSNERLRKMLVAKYGKPSGYGEFDAEYIADGKRIWRFVGNMELVYSVPWGSGDHYLTYLNKTEEARLAEIVKKANNKAAEKEAATKRSVF